MFFLGIISWKGASHFNGGRMFFIWGGGGALFLSPIGEYWFWWGVWKNHRMGDPPLLMPPTMGNPAWWIVAENYPMISDTCGDVTKGFGLSQFIDSAPGGLKLKEWLFCLFYFGVFSSSASSQCFISYSVQSQCFN